MSTYDELRQLAADTGIPIWTTSQDNKTLDQVFETYKGFKGGELMVVGGPCYPERKMHENDISVEPFLYAPAGEITTIFGEVASGKSGMAASLIKKALGARPGARVLFIETGSQWSDRRYGISPEEESRIHRISECRGDVIESYFRPHTILKPFDYSLIVIDDISGIDYLNFDPENSINLLTRIRKNIHERQIPLVGIVSSPSLELPDDRRITSAKETLLTLVSHEAYRAISAYERPDHLLRTSSNRVIGFRISYEALKSRSGRAKSDEFWIDVRNGRTYKREELEFDMCEIALN